MIPGGITNVEAATDGSADDLKDAHKPWSFGEKSSYSMLATCNLIDYRCGDINEELVRVEGAKLIHVQSHYVYELGASSTRGTALKQALGGGLSGVAGTHRIFLNCCSDICRSYGPSGLAFDGAHVYRACTKAFIAITNDHGIPISLRHHHVACCQDAVSGWRYCSGLDAPLVQEPVSQFGDTAADIGALGSLESKSVTRNLPCLA
jgi:hypothetical protein